MTELHFPWIQLSILLPIVGAFWVARAKNPESARRHCLAFCGLALACTIGGWIDFVMTEGTTAFDRWDVVAKASGRTLFVLDEFTAPLVPLASLLYLLVVLTTLRTKVRRYSFPAALASQAILLATLCCREPWGIIVLLAAGTVHPYLEMRARGKPTRVFAIHMTAFLVLLGIGWTGVAATLDNPAPWAVAFLVAAILIRSGIAPLHSWMTVLFEHAGFGTALLFVAPMLGTYAAVRLVVPIAPDWALQTIVVVSLVTAIYTAGMALVQRDTRRFFAYLFLSHSALVLVGLGVATPISLTAALSVWLSVGLALGGFGLTLRSIEARAGRLSLVDFHGLFEQMPMLAGFFLLTGMASVGFPGTFGFISTEMLIDSTVHAWATVGVVVVFAAALNGIAILQTWMFLFGGKRHVSSVSLNYRKSERFAIVALALLILVSGVFPQPGITSRQRAADQIIQTRGKAPRTSNSTTPSTSDLKEHK